MKAIMSAIFIFLTLSIIFVAAMLYTQEVVGDKIIGNFSAAGQDLIENDTFKQNIVSLENKYDTGGAKFNIDFLFMMGFFTLEVWIIVMSILSPKLPEWNFLTLLLFFSIMFVFAYSFVLDINTYIFDNYIVNIFDAEDTFLPWFNYILNNQLSIVFLNFIAVLGINFIFAKKGGSPFLGGA